MRTPYIDPADVIYVVLSLEYERVCVVCGLSYTGRTDGPYTRTHTPIYVRYQTDILDDARARMHARMHARRRVIDPRDAPNARPTSRTRRTFFSLSRARRRHAHRSRHHDPVVEVRFDAAMTTRIECMRARD